VGTHGEVYFPVGVSAAVTLPDGVKPGLARVDRNGRTRFVSAESVLGEPGQFVSNSTPALSNDERLVYAAAASQRGSFVLFALDSDTLAVVHETHLLDPLAGTDAVWISDSTAAPMVGPDGDVYFGVGSAKDTNGRGYLLHFDATLATRKLAGAFGWDDTPSVVPAELIPSYHGSSRYLIFSKYNNYIGFAPSGDGLDRVAVLDPNAAQSDAFGNGQVMKEVETVLGPTPDPVGPSLHHPEAVTEWCINTAAIDPFTGSVLTGSEDGKLYRWDLRSGKLIESVRLAPPLGEPYTPTAVGPDGSVLAINNAILFVVGTGGIANR
jgi:hypothetical protein